MLDATQLITSQEAARMLKMPPSTMDWWIRRGAVNPIIPAHGKGTPRIMTLKQTWAIAIARGVKKGGQSVETACRLAQTLESFSDDEIESSFAAGRTCILVLIIDGDVEFVPKLLRPEGITKNPELHKMQAMAKKDGRMLVWSGIDVKPIWDQIVSLTQHPRQTKKKK